MFSEKDFSKVKVKFVSKGKTIKIKRLKENHLPETAEFNFALVDFGFIFKPIQDKTIPLKQRIIKSNSQVQLLAPGRPEIKLALRKITELANLSGEGYKKTKNRFLYQKALNEVCQPMVAEIYEEGISKTLGLIIERGALLIGAFYNFPKKQLARIAAKRLDKTDGTFGLGLSNLSLPSDIKKFKRFHIQEDCIATGDSIGGIILALKQKGIFFENIQIDCPAASQFGVQFLLKFLKWLGVKKILIKTGTLVYALDQDYYLRRTIGEAYKKREYFVGDMGEWSKKLPISFNSKACWNKKRLD